MIRLLIALFFLLAPAAHAQNTTGVFGPTVSLDDHDLEYRAAFVDGRDGDVVWGQRLHYQKAVSESFRPRIILATRETSDGEVDFDFVRAEAVWQLTPDGQDYQSGARFEARVRGDGRPAELRANWANQWALGEGWRARAILLNTLQVSNRTNRELIFSGRFGVSRKVGELAGLDGVRLGVHAYVDGGDTGGVRLLKGNGAEMGPFISFDVTDSVGLYLGTLHGLTGGSDDRQFRMFLSKAF